MLPDQFAALEKGQYVDYQAGSGEYRITARAMVTCSPNLRKEIIRIKLISISDQGSMSDERVGNVINADRLEINL